MNDKLNLCNCGCGVNIPTVNKYVHGHNGKNKKRSLVTIERIRLSKIGKKRPDWSNIRNPRYNPNIIIKHCVSCNKQLTRWQSSHNLKNCSVKCHKKWQIGENTSGWLGGISKLPYHFNFNNKLKDSVIKRDGYRCQKCGLTQKQHINKYKTKLNVHHIDYDKINYFIDNLITLCCCCNAEVNSDRFFWYCFFRKLMIDRMARI